MIFRSIDDNDTELDLGGMVDMIMGSSFQLETLDVPKFYEIVSLDEYTIRELAQLLNLKGRVEFGVMLYSVPN